MIPGLTQTTHAGKPRVGVADYASTSL